MYVSISDASGFSELQNDLGLPTPTSDMPEVFGPYCGGGAMSGHWSYDPDTRMWEHHEFRRPQEMPEPEHLAAEDRRSFAQAAEWIAELAPPPLPADQSMIHRDKPFLYMGFKFQWLFIPELGRWEMLPLGRR